jgi:hypothetical protein
MKQCEMQARKNEPNYFCVFSTYLVTVICFATIFLSPLTPFPTTTRICGPANMDQKEQNRFGSEVGKGARKGEYSE